MTRDEFSDQLRGLVARAYQEHLPSMHLWGVLAEQRKWVEMVWEIEAVAQYKKAQDEV